MLFGYQRRLVVDGAFDVWGSVKKKQRKISKLPINNLKSSI